MKNIELKKNANPRILDLILESRNVFLGFFLVFSLIFGVIFGVVFFVFHKAQFDLVLGYLTKQEIQAVTIEKNIIKNSINCINSDLHSLATGNEIKEYLDTGNKNILSVFKQECKKLLSYRRHYGQFVYLNSSGEDIVRITYDPKKIFTDQKEMFQSQFEEFFNQGVFQLRKGEIFITFLDSGIKDNKTGQSLLFVCLGMSVFDSKEENRGIFLFNYLAQDLFNFLEKTMTPVMGNMLFLDSSGAVIWRSISQKEQDVLSLDKSYYRFRESYPEEWQHILREKTGYIYTADGLFTFTTIYPLQKEASSLRVSYLSKMTPADLEQSFWLLAAHVPSKVVGKYVKPFHDRCVFLEIVLFVFVMLVAFFLAVTITARQIYKKHLFSVSFYDMLTSLPNLRAFLQRLEEGISHAQRYQNKLGLLYIDLDGFKAVNDTFGHEAGDELLKEISKRMLAITRETDTVARIGGDEFAVILFQVRSELELQIAGKKIIDEINKPVSLSNGTATVGASVGGVIFPDTTRNPKRLVKCADQAMYLSKQRGKNTYTFSDSREGEATGECGDA